MNRVSACLVLLAVAACATPRADTPPPYTLTARVPDRDFPDIDRAKNVWPR